MAQRVQVRDLSNEEGRKLLSIIRRGSGSVVRWRRAQIVLWSAQAMDVPAIAKIAFTSEDRVREVIHNFNHDGFDSLDAKYAGGRPPKFTLPQRQRIKKIALARPTDHELPFSTWSLSKLAEFVVAEGVVDDISHEGLRALLREEGVSFQRLKTFKLSNDPNYEAKKNRVLELYAIADGRASPGLTDPMVIICVDEFGPLNLQPHPGRQWAPVAAGRGDPAAPRRRRRRATYKRPHGVRHLLAAYDLSTDRLYGHITTRKDRPAFKKFLRYVRSLHPADVRIGIVLDNFSPHISHDIAAWATAHNIELAFVPFYASWLNRIEAQFQALRYFTLDGTDHDSHATQSRMIPRYIAWRNRHATDRRLRELVNRANVASVSGWSLSGGLARNVAAVRGRPSCVPPLGHAGPAGVA
jgi:transposase